MGRKGFKGDKSHRKSKNRSGSELCSLLSYGCVCMSGVVEDLPGLIAAIDMGKTVAIQRGSEEGSEKFLRDLFARLPLQCDSDGVQWSRRSDCPSVSKHILSQLLQCGAVIQPTDIGKCEMLCIAGARKLLLLLEKYPALVGDIVVLLQNFLNGEVVDVSGIDAVDIREGVVSLFVSIGAENDDGYTADYTTEFFSLPSDSEVCAAVSLLINALQDANERGGGVSSLRKDNDLGSSVSGSDISESDRDSGTDSGSELPPPVSAIGPAVPSSAQLQSAWASMPNDAVGLMESDSDEDAGPSPAPASWNYVEEPSVIAPVRVAASAQIVRGEHEREEWMLTPGERKPFGEGLSEKMLGNRKFDRGKETKKAAAALSAQREKEYEEYLNSEEGKQTEATLQLYREKRGPSLVELHRQETAKKPKHGNPISEMQFFDRERDLLSHRKMDKNQAQKLVDQAKELDSRFNKSIVQKSFL
mmetsp:Transcript_3884/g.6078  ORF Transcript_3884/g.6078 Transcript_3884/m.6078 type:complete len:473 (+) Transcript_3884:50-1468(+)